MAFKLTPKSSGFKLKPKTVVDDMPPIDMPIEEPMLKRELTRTQQFANVIGNILSGGGQKVYSERPTAQELEYEKQSKLLAGAEVPLQMGGDILSAISAGAGTASDYLAGDGIQKPFGQRFQESAFQYAPTTEKSKKYYETVSENLAALPATSQFQIGARSSQLSKVGKTENMTTKVNEKIQKFVNKDYRQQLNEFTQNAKKNKIMQESSDAGYVFIPSTIDNPTIIQKLQESAVGTGKIAENAREVNQKTTNNLVRKYLGLEENTPLDLELMNKIRKKHGETYQKIDALEAPKSKAVVYDNVIDMNTGQPIKIKAKVNRNGAEVLEELKQTRFDLRDQWNFFKRSGNPNARKQAVELEKKVDRLEQDLVKIAKYNKKENLIPELRKARTEIAKAHLVEKALNDVTGNVDAKVFSKLAYDKRLVDPNAKKIARFYKGFSDIASVPKSTKQTPFSVLDVGLAGYGFATGNPAIGLPLLNKLYAARALQSPSTQTSLIRGQINEPSPRGIRSLLQIPNVRPPIPSEPVTYGAGLASLLEPYNKKEN
jgi:hypothetical protein